MASTPAPPAAPTACLPPSRTAVAAALRHAASALLAYAGVRTTGLLALTLWSHSRGKDVWPALAAEWDTEWYIGIATRGYATELGTEPNANNLAFFPLHPLLLRAATTVTPASPTTAGLVLAVLASFAAAWGIFAIGDHLHGRRVGTLLTTLWAALPVGLVQWMGYTESLFTACAAWSLYAVLTGRPLTAASLAVLAGLTRPTGIAVAAAVTVTALLSRRPRALAAALLAPLGWLGYVGWVGLRLGRWDGYFAVQRLWRNEWDGGVRTVGLLRHLLFENSAPELFLLMVTGTLLASVVLFGLSLADRQPLPLLVFTGVMLVIVLGSGGVYFPRARYLLPAFPLLLPLAVHLSRASRRFLTLALTGAVLGSAYCGAYMILIWRTAP